MGTLQDLADIESKAKNIVTGNKEESICKDGGKKHHTNDIFNGEKNQRIRSIDQSFTATHYRCSHSEVCRFMKHFRMPKPL